MYNIYVPKIIWSIIGWQKGIRIIIDVNNTFGKFCFVLFIEKQIILFFKYIVTCRFDSYFLDFCIVIAIDNDIC